jgi:alkylhydroperoxidase family enzyme
MLAGRSAGITEEKLAHLGDDPIPVAVYEPAELALLRYARASARNDVITDELYNSLSAHYSAPKMIEICVVVGLAGLTNRFHRTFMTDVDPTTNEALAESCPVPIPAPPQTAAVG